jgi:hypothetical protein
MLKSSAERFHAAIVLGRGSVICWGHVENSRADAVAGQVVSMCSAASLEEVAAIVTRHEVCGE